MSLAKVTYVNGETVIDAKNLNDIQDEIIDTAQAVGGKLQANQGAENAGKVLLVDDSGFCFPGSLRIPILQCISAAGAQTKSLPSSPDITQGNGFVFAVQFSSNNTSPNPVLYQNDKSFGIIPAQQNASFNAGSIVAGMHFFMTFSENFVLLLNPASN